MQSLSLHHIDAIVEEYDYCWHLLGFIGARRKQKGTNIEVDEGFEQSLISPLDVCTRLQ